MVHHVGPHKGQPHCPLLLQAVYDWHDEDYPDEHMYDSLCWHMGIAAFKRILAQLKTHSAAGLSGLSSYQFGFQCHCGVAEAAAE